MPVEDRSPPAKATTLVDPSNTTSLAMVSLTLLSIVMATGIVSIMLFGKADSHVVDIGLLTGALSPVLIALVGYMVTKKVDAVHVQINSRMDELLRERSRASMAEGTLYGRESVQRELNQQQIDMTVARHPSPIIPSMDVTGTVVGVVAGEVAPVGSQVETTKPIEVTGTVSGTVEGKVEPTMPIIAGPSDHKPEVR